MLVQKSSKFTVVIKKCGKIDYCPTCFEYECQETDQCNIYELLHLSSEDIVKIYNELSQKRSTSLKEKKRTMADNGK